MNYIDSMEKLIYDGLEKRVFPGCVVLVGNEDDILYYKAFGKRALKPYEEEITKDTIYDLASLTKVIATTTSIMYLVNEGKISIYDDVSNFLDEFNMGLKKKIKIFHLLTHTSGLPPYTNAWKKFKGEELLNLIVNTYPVYNVGTDVVYSCLNFVVLMRIVEVVSKMKFDEFTKKYIFDPLDMKCTSFKPKDIVKVAPTSMRDGEVLRGMPDDEIAYYLGGVSGNAGLFSCAHDIYKFCKIFLRKDEFLPYDVKHVFVERRKFKGKSRALGWAVKEDGNFMGETASEYAFGHTGFTGTFLVIDPLRKICIIFLSNRTHIERRKSINDLFLLRRRLHNMINLAFG